MLDNQRQAFRQETGNSNHRTGDIIGRSKGCLFFLRSLLGCFVHANLFLKNYFLGFFNRNRIFVHRRLRGLLSYLSSLRLGRDGSFNNCFLGFRLRIDRIRRLRVDRIRQLRVDRIGRLRISRIGPLRISRIGPLRISRIRGFRVGRIRQILILLLLVLLIFFRNLLLHFIDEATFFGHIALVECLAGSAADKVHTFAKETAFANEIPNVDTGHFNIAHSNVLETTNRITVLIKGFGIGDKEIAVGKLNTLRSADNSRRTGTAEVKTAARAAKIHFDCIVQSKRAYHRNLRRQSDGRSLGLQGSIQLGKISNFHRAV